MKFFLLSISAIGALIVSFFLITNVITINSLGEWIMFSSLMTLLFMCMTGIALNYKPSAVNRRVSSKIPDMFF